MNITCHISQTVTFDRRKSHLLGVGKNTLHRAVSLHGSSFECIDKRI